MVCWSAVAHLTVCILLVAFHFPAHFKEAPVYYVDVVNLPVAHPQAGTPSGSPAEPKTSAASPLPAPPASREMTMPAKPAGKVPPRPATVPSPKKAETAESDREFEDRLAKIEQRAAAGHEAAALDALRKRVAGRGAAGMPGATGNEAGSDYASYIQSRLTDAFRSTIAFQSRNPQVTVRITIGRSGRIALVRTERSTGDKVFEDAVARAIAKAEQSFPPPPNREQFEIGFVFRPQGVGKK
ncbi:MAG TPA: TonB family protein [Geobacteraceae bacterium]